MRTSSVGVRSTFQSYISPIQTDFPPCEECGAPTHFNPTLVQFKPLFPLKICISFTYFNPTLVQFKQPIPFKNSCRSAHFNPTLVQFKQGIQSLRYPPTLKFQSYISPIQTGANAGTSTSFPYFNPTLVQFKR